MNNNLKINLKYLIIIVVAASALMIIGALVIGFINARSQKPPAIIQSTNNAQPAVPALGGEGKKPERAIPLP